MTVYLTAVVRAGLASGCMADKVTQDGLHRFGMHPPDVVVGTWNQGKACVGEELGNLLHGPTGPNVVIAIEKKCRPVEVRDVVQQRWTLNVLLPRLINLGIDLKIRRVVVHGKWLETLAAPLFIYPVPLPIIVNPTTSDTYEAI